MKTYKLLKITPEQHKRIRILAAKTDYGMQVIGAKIIEAGLKEISKQ